MSRKEQVSPFLEPRNNQVPVASLGKGEGSAGTDRVLLEERAGRAGWEENLNL